MTNMAGEIWFSIAFHSVADILFLTLSILSALVVARSRWRVHLRWLIPLVIDDALTLLYRVSLNMHYFRGIHWVPGEYALTRPLLYAANVVGLYAMYTLWRTLVSVMPTSEPGEAAGVVHGSDVWPPPPTGAA